MEFGQLLPELIFRAVQAQGLMPTGVLHSLNSYENRVYEIHLEEKPPIIAKFYRPGRWNVAQIGEEHDFLDALTEAEVPVVPPLSLENPIEDLMTIGQVELDQTPIYYAFFPKFRGREHDEITDDDRRWMGRLLARLHNIGSQFEVRDRPYLNPTVDCEKARQFLLSQPFLPDDLKSVLDLTLSQAIGLLTPHFNSSLEMIAVHGDCHPGNVLWNAQGPNLVDFDDMMAAPPVQDVWMLFNGSADEQKKQREIFFEGYEMFRQFDHATLILAEPLRTLRMIRHAAWIGQRYQEPAFVRAFPYFEERRYWEGFLLNVKEQISALQELM